MPYINVDEVYILDNTGPQVDQAVDIPYVDAALTDAQKAQARANIAAGGTNPNLLDNPWWGSAEVVNQRGVTSWAGNHGAYCIDRWWTTFGSSAGAYSLAANGITISPTGGGSYMIQKFDNPTWFGGKVLTASLLLSDGTIYSGTITRVNNTTQRFFTNEDAFVELSFGDTNMFSLRVLYGGTATIRAVKMELGSVSTLANDAPPNYLSELLKCQRYFVRLFSSNASIFGFGFVNSGGTGAYILTPTPVTMRSKPSIAVSGSFGLRQNNTNTAVSSFTVDARTANGINLYTTGTFTANAVCTLFASASSTYIDLSADL